MVLEEAVSLCIAKDKLDKTNDEVDKTFVMGAFKYLFRCYSRIEIEEHEYPKVKYIFLLISSSVLCNIMYFILILISCIVYREVVLPLFPKHYKTYVHNVSIKL